MRPLTRQGYIPEEELPGTSTVVTDKSKSGLPNDSDREKEQVLPPGSATPKTPKKDDEAPGKGRDLPGVRYNGPGTGEDGPAEHPRTLPTPGESEGSPTKFDYNYVTRRSISATTEVVSYKARIPWRRQHKQPVWDRTHDKREYRLNKSKVRQRLKVWYKQVKRNQNFRTRKENRRENPDKYERLKVGADHPLAREVVAELVREAYSPWSLGQKRHRRRGPARVQRRQQYRRNRAQARRQHHIWYQKNRSKPAFKRRQQMRRRNPSRFKLRPASVLTAPEVAFVVGRDMQVGYVHAVSPMTGLVTVVLDGPVNGGSSALSMPTMVFLNAVVFLTPEDADAAFELIDVEVGPEAYADLDPEGVRQCAILYGVDPDSTEFRSVCMRLLGTEDIEVTAPADLSLVTTEIVTGSLEGGDKRTTEDTDDAEQGHLVDPRDDNLYFGEVHLPGDSPAARVASRYLTAIGEVVLRDQRSPEEGNWEKPEIEGRPYKPQTVDHWTGRDPAPTHDPTPPDYVPADEADFPAASGKVIPDDLKHARTKTAATIAEILDGTEGIVHQRSKDRKVRLKRADPQRGIWTFDVTGGEKTYRVRVKGLKHGNVKQMREMDVEVSCTCPFYRFQGPEHWAVTEDFMYGKPQGTAAAPKIRDPHRKHLTCKHGVLALNLALRYKVAAIRVASRFLEEE